MIEKKKHNWMRGFVIAPPKTPIEVAQSRAWSDSAVQRRNGRTYRQVRVVE